MLVRGGDSAFVMAGPGRATASLPAIRVDIVPGAGHAVQSDQPLALAALIAEFVPSA